MYVGESQNVTVKIANNGWSTPDVARSYWSTDAKVPASAANKKELQGVATLVAADTVIIDFGEYGTVKFKGPLGCM